MRLLFCWVKLLPLAGMSTIVHAAEDVPAGPIGSYVSILEDKTGAMDLREAIGRNDFVPSQMEVPNLGSSGSAFWLSFELPPAAVRSAHVLHIPHPEIDELDIWVITPFDTLHVLHNGQARRLAEVYPQGREFIVRFAELQLDPSLNKIVLRARSIKQLQVPILIEPEEFFTSKRSSRQWYSGFYVGMMVVLVLYNLFVFISVRDKSYLLYVVYLTLVLFTQLAFFGIAPTLLWPDNAFLLERASLLLTLFTAVSATEFIHRFSDTRRYTPRMFKGSRLFYFAFAASIAIYFTPWPWVGYQAAQAVSGLYAFYVLAMAFMLWRSGSPSGGFIITAWSVFLIGTMVFVLKDAGVLPYNELTLYIMPFGSALEGILLSFGLADRINVLRREKEASQAQALAASLENERIIREQNVILESKVKERTAALQESNDTLKRTQAHLVQSEKMASLGQLTAGIAHEINNPINFITSNIQPLRRDIADVVEMVQAWRNIPTEQAAQRVEELRRKADEIGLDETITELGEIVESIAEGSHRTAEIVRGLRNFSRLHEDDLKDMDINDGVRSTLAVLTPQFKDRVQFDMDLGIPVPVECFPGKVNQLLMNLLTNAAQATLARPGDVERRVKITTRNTPDGVEVRISDNGIGMSPEVQARIFEPFFTTKPVGEGTGLGMAIVYGIVEEHHGTISITSAPNEGTTIAMGLPLRQPRSNQRRA